ncbi:peptide deformylase [Clostridium algidicarnis]|nr:peptide deformylase [Clostridium algidicarnis]
MCRFSNATSIYIKEITLTATGDLVKCFCHEIYHLEGILFTNLITEYVK